MNFLPLFKFKRKEEFYYSDKNIGDFLSPFYQQNVINFFLSKIGRKDLVILDYGCGLGNNFNNLLKFGLEIDVVDINVYVIKKLRKKFKDEIRIRPFLLKNFKKRTFENKYDLIVCTEVLEHVKDKDKLIKKLRRLLKRKGFLIISVPNYFNFTGIVKKIIDLFRRREEWNPWGTHSGGFESFTTAFGIRKLLYSGFEIVDDMGVNLAMAFFPKINLPGLVYELLLFKLPRIPFMKNLAMNYYILVKKK